MHKMKKWDTKKLARFSYILIFVYSFRIQKVNVSAFLATKFNWTAKYYIT
jgi:hypothetical protein